MATDGLTQVRFIDLSKFSLSISRKNLTLLGTRSSLGLRNSQPFKYQGSRSFNDAKVNVGVGIHRRDLKGI